MTRAWVPLTARGSPQKNGYMLAYFGWTAYLDGRQLAHVWHAYSAANPRMTLWSDFTPEEEAACRLGSPVTPPEPPEGWRW